MFVSYVIFKDFYKKSWKRSLFILKMEQDEVKGVKGVATKRYIEGSYQF